MLQIVQLTDGCYKVTIDYSCDGFAMHREYIFKAATSDAEPCENGEVIRLRFEGEGTE